MGMGNFISFKGEGNAQTTEDFFIYTNVKIFSKCNKIDLYDVSKYKSITIILYIIKRCIPRLYLKNLSTNTCTCKMIYHPNTY